MCPHTPKSFSSSPWSSTRIRSVTEASLYVHIPFCARVCDFCAFYTEPVANGRVDEFLNALERELEIFSQQNPFVARTVYLGGGTPSILSPRQFERFFAKLRSLKIHGDQTREFTIEAMPATIAPDKARLWREHGVNRVSLGVQSLDETLLDRLGRPHSVADVEKTFAILRTAGFDNINLDLIFAIPGQTLDAWRLTLDRALALAAEHCSTYELTYEDHTVMTAARDAGTTEPIDAETATEMYETGIAALAECGYRQYEISNFARDGFRSLHNLNYWQGGDCAAVGPSAGGYWRGTRTKNVPDLGQYRTMVSRGVRPIVFAETLPPRQRAGELAAFALRMNDGVNSVWFREKTGFALEELWRDEIADLCTEGLVEFEGGQLRLTARGRSMADAVAERLVMLPEVAAIR